MENNCRKDAMLGLKKAGNPLLDLKISFPKDIVDALDVVSQKFNISRSQVIRTAVKEFLHQLRRDCLNKQQESVRVTLGTRPELESGGVVLANGNQLEKSST